MPGGAVPGGGGAGAGRGQMAFRASVLVTTRPRAPYSCSSPNISMRMDWSRRPTGTGSKPGGPDQLGGQVPGRVVVGGIEQHRPVGLPPGGRGQRPGRQRAERLDQPRPGRQQAGQDLARGLLRADDLAVPAGAVRPDRVARIDDHLAGQPRAVLGDELPEVVEPDGHHEHASPVDRLVDAHRFGVAVQVGRDLPGGLLVAAGQQEVLTAGREVRRQRAADGAGSDDGNRAVRDTHLDPPSVMWFPRQAPAGRAAGRSEPLRLEHSSPTYRYRLERSRENRHLLVISASFTVLNSQDSLVAQIVT